MKNTCLFAALLSFCFGCGTDTNVPTEPQGVAELQGIPAFPGAEGFGSHTPGGRGGEILFVTNLDADGPGSLRAALEASGPRIVIFKVGGTIVLNGAIKVRNPFVTIAGQSAPGEGISMRNGMISFQTHDFVIRGVRFRVGDDPLGTPPGIRNGIEVLGEDAYNGIIDHCSISWGVDENVGITGGAHDITVCWSIIAEGLRNSIHPEGKHSKGLMVNRSAGTNHSLHHNVIAHNADRNPQAVAPGNIEVVNNLVYNYVFGGRFDNNAKVHFIGNRWIPGPDTPVGRRGIIVGGAPGTTRVYVEGNIGPERLTDGGDEWLITDASPEYRSISFLFAPTGITTQSADESYESVLDSAGAFPRDPIDERVVNDIRTGTGRIIDSEHEVGGWPTLVGGLAPFDGDGDGIPDYWEAANNLNLEEKDDFSDHDGNGYTAIEEYLNGLMTSNARLMLPW